MYRFLILITFLLSVTLTAPLAAQDAPPEADPITAALQTILDDSLTLPNIAGVLQVTTAKGTWTVTTGYADSQTETPTAPDSRFRIGSIGKIFIGVVILQLVEEGVFGLDDPISAWLPADVIANLANADTATIRQLLAMRSGIPNYLEQAWIDGILADPYRTWTALEVLPYAADRPALFAAGDGYSYSNTNYILLQLIAEGATGQSLATLIRERILTPLNLTDTYTQISETLPGGFVDAFGNWGENGALIEVTDFNDGAGLGDGGQVSSAGDLTTLFRALLDERSLLNAESLAAMMDFGPMDFEGGQFGLGLQAFETPYGMAYGRAGNVLGFFTASIYLPEYDISVTALYATDAPDIYTAVVSALAVAIGDL